MAEGRIAIAMSGGVDSSTAALILKDAGWDLVGFSMQLWDRTRNISEDEEISAGGCCSPDDFFDAVDDLLPLGSQGTAPRGKESFAFQ